MTHMRIEDDPYAPPVGECIRCGHKTSLGWMIGKRCSAPLSDGLSCPGRYLPGDSAVLDEAKQIKGTSNG